MADQPRPRFSAATGASSKIGPELARLAAQNEFDLVVVSHGSDIEEAAVQSRLLGVTVDAVQADLATPYGVDALYDKGSQLGRPLDELDAKAGRGLGKGFLDQDFTEIERIIATNVTGTTYLLGFVRDMRDRNAGRVLIKGSIAGLMPGGFQTVNNATKAYIDSFAYALRNQLQDTDVVVTVLLPGPTETDLFEIAGWANKLQAMMTRFLPDGQLAQMHPDMAEPGSGKHH